MTPDYVRGLAAYMAAVATERRAREIAAYLEQFAELLEDCEKRTTEHDWVAPNRTLCHCRGCNVYRKVKLALLQNHDK